MLQHEKSVLPEFDERREIWRLLKHLTPQRRIQWLQWCCKQISSPSAETFVEESDGTVSDVYHGAMSLFYGSHLTMELAGQELVRMARGK